MKLARSLMTFGTVAVVVSFLPLAYLYNALLERGYVADATGSDGSATSTERLVIIAAGAGLVLGVIAVIVGLVMIIAAGRKAAAIEPEPAA